MKFTAVLLFLAAIIMAVCAVPFQDKHVGGNKRPGQGGFPSFPGQGSFNPKLPNGPWGKPVGN